MKISELSARSGVALPTVKYYLREGLLMAGEPTSATGAQYGDDHIRRLGLIRALSGAGLSIPRIRAILDLVSATDLSEFERIGRAIAQLPPHVENDPVHEFPRAQKVLEFLGQVYDPRYVAVAHLEQALIGLEGAGLTLSEERLRAYGEHIRGIAEVEIDLMPLGSTEEAVRYAVLGTAMYEPVLTALRRLAHQDLGSAKFTSPAEHTTNRMKEN
ncbi:MerR family transcriptional regulator [Rhodococcus sp. AD45-ID]|uniref:MerR family transcriptional regulator n=1 Tax=unclassified Rhodococcus (in: high G+C Gram-positive bacteria) TaxID=192944 RepID=UPI0005D35B02|nr:MULTISPECIES: MerR family transcriptional regulator [unclassified Rhodococcus (in: high G+C Gram-positive bacteria)]KJF23151.1 Hg(II)-responsive transcriptional regulator [Rhodococcus sp. AD45]PSR41651.1 MerR family transcriptional regulator [Rhodococcus sp. AD45-ID]